MDFVSLLASPAYDFLRKDRHLKDQTILIGLGGSWAYGTNQEGSDVDIRGCALNSKEEILLGKDFEQFVDLPTDTTIYSFNKLIRLLTSCNPNTIELLGLREDHYLYLTDIGRELLANTDMFLSRKAISSFGGYANAQLRRLDNKAARKLDQTQLEQHIFNSIRNAACDFPGKYFPYPENAIRLYVDSAVNPEMDTEIFMDVSLTHYPLRDYKAMWSEMNSIVKDYARIGKRSKDAIEPGKLGKHMMHLVRLYLMCFDILERGEIVTYREAEHDLLMDIRSGKYLNDNGQPDSGFFEMIEELEKRLEYDAQNTSLPDEPDYVRINEFTASVNERIVKEQG